MPDDIQEQLIKLLETCENENLPHLAVCLGIVLSTAKAGYAPPLAAHLQQFAKLVILPTLEQDVLNYQAKNN